MMDERSEALAGAARPLRDLVPTPADGLPDAAQFQRVVLEGVYDHAAQALLGPRSAPAGAGVGGNAPPGAANASGWDVVTPLTCADGVRVLVNRGWVPRESIAAVDQPAGRQAVSGVLKAGEARNKYATNDTAAGRYIWLDLDTLSDITSSAPLYVVAVNDGASGGGGGDRGGGGGGGKPKWPHARPLDSFMNFHVKPSTHLVCALSPMARARRQKNMHARLTCGVRVAGCGRCMRRRGRASPLRARSSHTCASYARRSE